MSRQRAVATRTREAARKERLLQEALARFPEGATPALLSRETGLNHNTVKTLLPRLSGTKKVIRGVYKVAEQGDGGVLPGELREWNFHNLVLRSHSVEDARREAWDFGLVRAELVISLSGRVSLRLSSDWPLNVSSLCLVEAFLRRVVLLDAPVVVSSVEFNRDFSNLRFDGVRAVTLSSLVEQFKVYQKRRGLRVERKALVPFSMENLVSLLAANPGMVEASSLLQRQSLVLERLVSASAAHQKLLFRLVDELRGGGR